MAAVESIATLREELARLRRSEQRYRTLAEHSTAGIWQVTADGLTLYANPAMCDLLEVPDVAALDGLTIFDFFDAAQCEVVRSELARRSDGVASTYEVELTGVRGRRAQVVIAGAPVLDEHGALIELVATFTDVTAHRRAETDLETANQQLRIALSAARVGVWDWSITDDFIRSVVRSGQQTPLSLSLGTALQRIYETDRDRVARTVHDALTDPQRDGFELEFRVHDEGTIGWRAAKAHIFRDAVGKATHAAGAAIDITELKQLEARLVAAQRLESLGRLAGGIAHDFNNVLTIILSAATSARNAIAAARGRSDARDLVSTCVADIEAAVSRARALTQQLLAFARRQEIEIRAIELGSLLRSTHGLLARTVGDDIELVVEIADDLSAVRADPGQLEQVILNLVINAREAMPSGGRVVLAARNAGDEVVVSVADTGHGMDGHTRERAFEPFFTTKEGGTGLGLATSYGIVTQLGGNINVSSVPGHGTNFEVRLPASAPRSGERPEPAAQPAPDQQTILVVDDDALVRGALVRNLRSLGFDVISAPGGVEALAVASTHAVDLLLTDVMMPRMNGRELAARFRERHPDVPIVFVSGYSPDTIEPDERSAFVAKPYDIDHLADTIRDLLGRA